MNSVQCHTQNQLENYWQKVFEEALDLKENFYDFPEIFLFLYNF